MKASSLVRAMLLVPSTMTVALLIALVNPEKIYAITAERRAKAYTLDELTRLQEWIRCCSRNWQPQRSSRRQEVGLHAMAGPGNLASGAKIDWQQLQSPDLRVEDKT